ncbi:MAG: flagellum-specific ATP synthase FliI, partial [Pseudomonadota bacterium]
MTFENVAGWAHDLAGDFNPLRAEGRVAAACGSSLDIEDRLGVLDIGARLAIDTNNGAVLAEVVSIDGARAQALPFDTVEGVRRGARVSFDLTRPSVRPSNAWLGRVVDGLGRPVDGKGPIRPGRIARSLRASPPPAALRGRLGPPV